MLRIHFTDADLARTRVVRSPDPMWEITTSLHRLQTKRGRWFHAEWHRSTRDRIVDRGLGSLLKKFLLPLFPRAAYFPDFLTPGQGAHEELDGCLEGMLATSPDRVLKEMAILDRRVGAPSWAPRIAEKESRQELAAALRAYHDVAVAPYAERMQARMDPERALRCRHALDGGIGGMLASLAPTMCWRPPVLHVSFSVADRDLYLNGRGLVLIPSYFAAQNPTTLADPELPPVLVYPVHRAAPERPPLATVAANAGAPLTALLGRARAGVLRATAAGATTGEIARVTGISASSASKHTTTLREAGLIISHRHATTVLHTLTPAGAAVLRAATRTAPDA